MGKLNYSWFKLTYCAVILCSVVANVCSVSLDPDGYYHIVIAINEKTAQNANEKYIENLKVSIQDLSDAIFESTSETFSIRSADIVLPNHWNVEADGFVTTQNFQNADIRISHEYSVPQTINPTFCGYPGHHIQLPYNYFDEKDTGLYGPTGKSLLTLWGRYRWGIFEEHGYPSDSQFPYYWKEWAPWIPVEEDEDPLPELWKVTSCSNAEIKGKYETVDAEQECGPDYVPPVLPTESPVPAKLDDEPDYPPPSECLFFPDIENQTATTSLMSFPYIKSLLSFCDETNHNKRAPNRQNLFCQFKSAWEVIKLSKDWRQLKNPEGSGNKRSPINYRIVKKSEKPLLFILSEGVNQPPEKVITTMASQLDVIFNKSQHWNVLVSAGVFPGKDTRDSHDTVYPWNTPWYNREELITAFRDSFGSRESTLFRPFGAAIQDIGNKIKERDHSAGAVIVVIKYGSETDWDLQNQVQAYESEVITTIVTQNIRLFALEGIDSQADFSNPFRLKNLAEMSGGLHFEIGGNAEQDIEHVNNVMSEVDTTLTTGSVPNTRFRYAFKDARRSEGRKDPITLPVLVNFRNVKSISFYFHTISKSYDLTRPQISSGPDSVTFPQFEEVNQWSKSEFDYVTYLAKWTAEPDQPLLEPSTWTYTFEGYNYDCDTVMVVLAELGDEDENKISAEDDGFTISIFTSASEDDNMVDLNVETAASLKGTAFSIYALVEKNGHPVNSPNLEVTAHIMHFIEGKDISYYFIGPIELAVIPLTDNGQSMTPAIDLTANDGIFSGNYIPSSEDYGGLLGDDGVFQIFVTARLVQTTVTTLDFSASHQLTQRCGSSYQGCFSETVTQPFFAVAESTRRIRFSGAHEFSAAATRVLDLRVSELSPGRYNIEWTEPSVHMSTGAGAAYEFEMNYANDFDQLLIENFRDQVYAMPYPIGAGRPRSIIVDDLEEGENRWYVLRSTVQGNSAPTPLWSNVLFVHGSSSFFQTTTTTTTTTTPQPTSSTTRLPTVSTGRSTLPTQATTASTTTTTTRRATPSTTRPSTTGSSTTSARTTVKFEITTEKSKRWYKAPEAIATFSVFGVGMIAITGGVITYIKMINRE